MMLCFKNKTDAVQFAKDLSQTFPDGSVWITTISPARFVVCYAPTVTNLSSEDTERLKASFFSQTQVNT